MLKKLIIWIGLRREKQLLRMLAKIEFGVSIFCRKLAVTAYQDKYPNLAELLINHAKDEENHGKMLASLADGSDRPTLAKTGTFKPTGEFENFDGISKRYYSLRWFFKDRHAFDHDWGDRLAFMQLLECETQAFYEVLSKSNCSEPLKAIASKIADDEQGHGNYLSSLLYCYSEVNIEKWRRRLILAKLGLIVDVWKAIAN